MDCALNGQEGLPHSRLARDEHNIKTRFQIGMKQADCLFEQTTHPIAHHSLTETFGGNKSIAVVRQAIRQEAQDKEGVAVGAPFLAQACEVFWLVEPVLLLNPQLISERGLARVPIHLLDVVRRYGQAVTPLRATRLQHTTTTLGLHPLAEAVNARAAANLRLPCSLG